MLAPGTLRLVGLDLVQDRLDVRVSLEQELVAGLLEVLHGLLDRLVGRLELGAILDLLRGRAELLTLCVGQTGEGASLAMLPISMTGTFRWRGIGRGVGASLVLGLESGEGDESQSEDRDQETCSACVHRVGCLGGFFHSYQNRKPEKVAGFYSTQMFADPLWVSAAIPSHGNGWDSLRSRSPEGATRGSEGGNR